MATKALIIGTGYTGVPLACKLQEKGREIIGWSYSPETAEALAQIHPNWNFIHGDVADKRAWAKVPSDVGEVIHCASSGRGGEEAYARVFVEGWRNIVSHLPKAKMLFVSSTSVYGQKQGEIVDEETEAQPDRATGKLLREAEKIMLSAGGVVARSAGIYGPGRAAFFLKLQRGEAVIEGVGTRWMNQIHQHDLVAAVVHLLKVGQSGGIYNVCDDEPTRTLDYFRWSADYLKKDMPPFAPADLQRKRGNSNKRISNSKLKSTGWKPRFPTFREGLRDSFPL